MADDVDILSDLQDGSFDAGTTVPNAQPGQGGDATPIAPPGTQPVHGKDARPVNAQPTAQDADAAKDKSVRELLSSAFKGQDGTTAPNQQQAASAGDAPQLTKDAAGVFRNLDGTFANAEQIAAFETAQVQQAAPPVQFQTEGLTPAELQQFQSLPAELQQFVGRTMEGLNQQKARYSEYDLLEQQIGPRREAWATNGMSPAVAVNQLFALSDFAGKAPGDFVMWFADQNKLDLDALLDARDAALSNVDPVVSTLQQTVQQLQGQIGQFTTQQAEAAHNERLSLVQNFAAEKDGAGMPLRPYYADVAGTIGGFISALKQQNPNMPNVEVLQKAYDNACWADTTVRAKMHTQVDAQTKQRAAEAAARARAAGSSVHGGPAGEAGTVPNNGNRSLREELVANFNAQRG